MTHSIRGFVVSSTLVFFVLVRVCLLKRKHDFLGQPVKFPASITASLGCFICRGLLEDHLSTVLLLGHRSLPCACANRASRKIHIFKNSNALFHGCFASLSSLYSPRFFFPFLGDQPVLAVQAVPQKYGWSACRRWKWRAFGRNAE